MVDDGKLCSFIDRNEKERFSGCMFRSGGKKKELKKVQGDFFFSLCMYICVQLPACQSNLELTSGVQSGESAWKLKSPSTRIPLVSVQQQRKDL